MRNSTVDFDIYLQEHVFQVKKNNGQLAAGLISLVIIV